MAKFKVGQKVKIRKLVGDMRCGFNEGMKRFEGKVAIITSKSGFINHIDLDNGGWNWSDEMLMALSKKDSKPKVLSKEKINDECIIYTVRFEKDLDGYELEFIKLEDGWNIEIGFMINRQELLFIESILRGLNS